MLFEAPCKLDFFTSPRLAARAAPAAFCWAFDLAGMVASFETMAPAEKCRLALIVPSQLSSLRQNSPLKSAGKRDIA
ncbi:hypothetical protein AGR9A_Cc120120 [Agrobacterium salinitolerans str. Hayward 0363]|nr:hypothetical protein AGR9A_Cc120120 [Agrobacterium salinitolerans str. Hayward 0363]